MTTKAEHLLGGKGVVGRVGGKNVFLGSLIAGGEKVALPPDQAARIAELNDQGKSVSVLLVNDVLAGFIAMRDEPRPDALAGLKVLTDAGIRTIMLTGDNQRTAAAIGKQLGVEVRAELLPENKAHCRRAERAGADGRQCRRRHQ